MHPLISQGEYTVIVERVAYRATRDYPQLAERLERAKQIVLREDQPVVVYADGSATVRSQREAHKTYQVSGPVCECPDHEFRQRLCVHSLAAGLYKRAGREAQAEGCRKASYRTQYTQPGTPGAFAACKACGIIAVLNAAGLCPEDAAEPRFYVTPKGAQALAGVAGAWQAARQQKQGA